MSEYTVVKEVYGHGSITLTYFQSSQRVSVVQVGENAVMDASDLLRFIETAGLLTEVERVAAEKAYERALEDLTVGGFLNDADLEMLSAWHNPYSKGGE